jgi:hypothetical protein
LDDAVAECLFATPVTELVGGRHDAIRQDAKSEMPEDIDAFYRRHRLPRRRATRTQPLRGDAGHCMTGVH